jgi:hypothetical protein
LPFFSKKWFYAKPKSQFIERFKSIENARFAGTLQRKFLRRKINPSVAVEALVAVAVTGDDQRSRKKKERTRRDVE